MGGVPPFPPLHPSPTGMADGPRPGCCRPPTPPAPAAARANPNGKDNEPSCYPPAAACGRQRLIFGGPGAAPRFARCAAAQGARRVGGRAAAWGVPFPPSPTPSLLCCIQCIALCPDSSPPPDPLPRPPNVGLFRGAAANPCAAARSAPAVTPWEPVGSRPVGAVLPVKPWQRECARGAGPRCRR